MEFVTITPSRSSLPSNVTSVLINAFLADYAFIIRPSTTVLSHKKHGLSHIYKERMNQENQRIKNSILSAQNQLKKKVVPSHGNPMCPQQLTALFKSMWLRGSQVQCTLTARSVQRGRPHALGLFVTNRRAVFQISTARLQALLKQISLCKRSAKAVLC